MWILAQLEASPVQVHRRYNHNWALLLAYGFTLRLLPWLTRMGSYRSNARPLEQLHMSQLVAQQPVKMEFHSMLTELANGIKLYHSSGLQQQPLSCNCSWYGDNHTGPTVDAYSELLLLSQVNVLDDDVYRTGVERAIVASLVCGCLACFGSVLLAMMMHKDFPPWILLLSNGILSVVLIIHVKLQLE